MEAPSTSDCCSPTCLSPPVYKAPPGRTPQRTAQLSSRWHQRHSGQFTWHRPSERDVHSIRASCRRRRSRSIAAGLQLPAGSWPSESSHAEPGVADAQGRHRLRSIAICIGLTLVLSGLSAWLPRSALASLAISNTAITREGGMFVADAHQSCLCTTCIRVGLAADGRYCKGGLLLLLCQYSLRLCTIHVCYAQGFEQRCAAPGQAWGQAFCTPSPGRTTLR